MGVEKNAELLPLLLQSREREGILNLIYAQSHIAPSPLPMPASRYHKLQAFRRVRGFTQGGGKGYLDIKKPRRYQ